MENSKSVKIPAQADYLLSLSKGDSLPLEAAAAKWYEAAQTNATQRFATENPVTKAKKHQDKANTIIEKLNGFLESVDATVLTPALSKGNYTVESFKTAIGELESLANGNPNHLAPTAVVRRLSDMLLQIERTIPNNDAIKVAQGLLFDISDAMRTSEVDVFTQELETIIKTDSVLLNTQVPLITLHDYDRLHQTLSNWNPVDYALELTSNLQNHPLQLNTIYLEQKDEILHYQVKDSKSEQVFKGELALSTLDKPSDFKLDWQTIDSLKDGILAQTSTKGHTPTVAGPERCAPIQAVLLETVLPNIQQQQQLCQYKKQIQTQLNSLNKDISAITLKNEKKANELQGYIDNMNQLINTHLNENNPNITQFKTESSALIQNTKKNLKEFTPTKNKIGKLLSYIMSLGIVAVFDEYTKNETGFSIFSTFSSTETSLKEIQKTIHESPRSPKPL